jgi:hypothetical protein
VTRLAGALATAAVAAACATVGGTAHAAPVNWDAIAQCESSGNWHTPNGGGLQIKPQTWWANGGVGLPALAPKAEQIRVAKNIMASQGPKAWPQCASAPAATRPGSIGAIFGNPGGDDQGLCWLLLRCH